MNTPNRVVEFLKANGLRIDRDNYLAVAHLGNPPEELDAEQEMTSAINDAADARFMFLVTGEDRQLLHDISIAIEDCEPARECSSATADSHN
jgi:hypothetical protein